MGKNGYLGEEDLAKGSAKTEKGTCTRLELAGRKVEG